MSEFTMLGDNTSLTIPVPWLVALFGDVVSKFTMLGDNTHLQFLYHSWLYYLTIHLHPHCRGWWVLLQQAWCRLLDANLFVSEKFPT